MKSITIASSNKSLFGLAIDNTKTADSNYPKGYYACTPWYVSRTSPRERLWAAVAYGDGGNFFEENVTATSVIDRKDELIERPKGMGRRIAWCTESELVLLRPQLGFFNS
jgi:hypothetical protein